MPSSYSALLRTELVAVGEQSGTWGTTNNKNIGTLLEAAISGIATVVIPDADYTLTALNGAVDEARSMGLNLTGALTGAKNVICPTSAKLYVVKNATTGGFAVTVKTAAGTGVAVLSGAFAVLECDGTNVVQVTLPTAFTSATLAAAVTDETGTGSLVFGTSPTLTTPTLNSPVLTTPALGTPASGTLTSCTGLPVATGVSGLGAGTATFLATPSSANLAAAVTDETGTGALVFASGPTISSPVLVTPALGTPASGNLTSCTGLPVTTGVSGLGAGAATFLATPSSANLAAAVTDETGTGALVFADSPALAGLPTAPTAVVGTATTQIATTAHVAATAFTAALPGQAGNAGKFVTTDGVNASWSANVATGGGTATGTNTGDNAVNTLYSGLVSNVTHTGDATGATGLTVVAINSTNMAALATGILKNTTTTGVPSIAVAGTDYVAPSGALGTPASGTLANCSGLPATGVTGTAATLGAANTFTAAQNFARATVASHATTGDIWGAAGNQIDWTGTATTTAFPDAPQAGAERVLICAGACSFTAGANMLIDGVASASTVTCAANDQVIVRAVSTTQFKLSRVKYDGTAQVTSPSDGGATITSSAVDITLTSASTRVQVVTMTASGKAVTLPDATTLNEGGVLFAVKNVGSHTFAVRNSAGTLLAVVAGSQLAAFYLSDNSAAAGVWAVGDETLGGAMDFLLAQAEVTIVTATNYYADSIGISETQAIGVWYESPNIKACTLNVSGTTLTAGAILTVVAEAPDGHLSITALSATQAVAAWRNSGTNMRACTLNVSGTTLTAGAILSVNATNTAWVSVTSVSATQAVVAYLDNSASGVIRACTLNVSGTTLTAGAILEVLAAAATAISVDTLSATQVILCFNYTASTSVYGCTLNVSGTTLTAGAFATFNTGTATLVSVVALSETAAIVAYRPASTFVEVKSMSISGTTVTPGTGVAVNALNCGSISTSKMSPTKALVGYSGPAFPLHVSALRLSGASVRISGDTLAINNQTSTGYVSLSRCSDARTIALGRAASDYLKATLLEVAQ